MAATSNVTGGRDERHSVQYYSKTNWQILTQMYGSVWPRVLPYCLLNVAISAVAQILMANGIDLDMSDASHSFMNMLVAFLIVARINMSVARYNDCRSCLGKMINETRRLLENMNVLTRKMTEPADREWRNETTYRALLLLRTAMAVIDYQSEAKPAWELDELDAKEAAELKQKAQSQYRSDPHSDRSEYDETIRVPHLMAFKLRWCLDTSEDRLSAPLNVYRAQSGLYNCVDGFVDGYNTCMKLLGTPFPFPLMQMTRIFLLFYIFTVPFALLSDVSEPVIHLLVIFFLTYGFVGLEIIALELDDPFGGTCYCGSIVK